LFASHRRIEELVVQDSGEFFSVDIALIALMAFAAIFAGGVVAVINLRPSGVAKAALAGLGSAVGVAGAFALMLVGANLEPTAVGMPIMFTVGALFAAAVVYLTLRRDLHRAKAAAVAIAVAAVVTASMVFVSYLAIFSLIGAAGIYLLLRLKLRIRPAMLVMGGALGCLLTASAAVFVAALASM
jgi:hypothetical protein